ncbi:DUF4352 domain-containing protein [Rhodococcus marinonascens]|uniref:DUF4352 domain-containing protein n=1 Tax=Rhodococcus marinonascens TaxID=38311 RepID=UPI000934E31D|nr:DUF4352 domain-containing protein [Rhodococcus marinonascens]
MTFPQQPAPPQPIPPAQPPKNKAKKWPWIVGAIAAVVGISAVAGGGEDDTKTADAPAPAAVDAVAPAADQLEEVAPAPEQTLPGLGTPVRDGKFEFVVTDVETGLSSIGDNPFLTSEAQGQFVVVTMTVQNTSDEPKGLSPSSQDMYDAQGRKFTADTSAGIALDSDVSIWDEINPGNTVTMKAAYDMPADAVPAEIELHDSMFSGGTRVALR